MRQTWTAAGAFLLALIPTLAPGDEPAAGSRAIDATTLKHKVLCGYQGWFRCPGDPTPDGWRHWSRRSERIAPNTITFEMWPDMSELGAQERYPAPGFTNPDGTPAHLFSSANPATVERHFRWMAQYGIDGVFFQRFLGETGRPSLDLVLGNVRAAAAATGRVYALCYDLSGVPERRIESRLTADWKRLVDELKVTGDARYLRHGGKPVLFVWGFFPDRFSPALAHRIIDFFKNDERYGVTLVGGCDWPWRSVKDPEWARAFRRFDVLSPWNVGNATRAGASKRAATRTWKGDLDEARKAGVAYLPVIYPGFGWTNLKGPRSAGQTISRDGGAFFWEQFAAAAELGMDMAYVAMFDEVDEGTAILKVTNSPPKEATFATYDGLPADWYLRLTGEGSKVIRGERPAGKALPFAP